MKNIQSGFVGIAVAILIALAGIGGVVYLYIDQKPQVEFSTAIPGETGLSDAVFEAAVENEDKGKIMARGDINGDGFEDAIVEQMSCGASCSISLQVVLNEGNVKATLLKDKNYPDTFSPAYVASSAAKSQVTNISIKNGVISLTGKGLACSLPGSEDPCTEEKWHVVKTVTYKFDGTNMVQID